MTFYWDQRQVRIEGKVLKVDEATSDAYYFSRPVGSQIGAWISPQSQPIDHSVLEEKQATMTEHFKKEPLTRPPFWGGYRLCPDAMEFWQGRPSRLHDRFRYQLDQNEWHCERLAP